MRACQLFRSLQFRENNIKNIFLHIADYRSKADAPCDKLMLVQDRPIKSNLKKSALNSLPGRLDMPPQWKPQRPEGGGNSILDLPSASPKEQPAAFSANDALQPKIFLEINLELIFWT